MKLYGIVKPKKPKIPEDKYSDFHLKFKPSMRDFYKKKGEFLLDSGWIKGPLLSFLLIPEIKFLTQWSSGRVTKRSRAIAIVNEYLKREPEDRDVLECQFELATEGLGDFAKL